LKAIIADRGPLYAEVDRDDQYHARSRSELKKINQEKLAIIVSYPIFLEAHKLILYSGGLKAALSFSERLITQTNLLNPTSNDYQEALELIARFPDQSITLSFYYAIFL
jgi:hypothetical protein